MRYLLAIILPPVAILLCYRPVTALLNIPLWFLGWIPGVIHAMLVVGQHNADKRNKAMIAAQERGARRIAAAVTAGRQ